MLSSAPQYSPLGALTHERIFAYHLLPRHPNVHVGADGRKWLKQNASLLLDLASNCTEWSDVESFRADCIALPVRQVSMCDMEPACQYHVLDVGGEIAPTTDKAGRQIFLLPDYDSGELFSASATFKVRLETSRTWSFNRKRRACRDYGEASRICLQVCYSTVLLYAAGMVVILCGPPPARDS
eukprot:4187266-Amphidinium_carterae.1